MLIPGEHLLRRIEKTVDFSFIYPLAEDRCSPDKGKPGADPAVLVKTVLIQYLYGIRSMRQTIEEIQYNVAYRWFWDTIYTKGRFIFQHSEKITSAALREQTCLSRYSPMWPNCVCAKALFVDATHTPLQTRRDTVHTRAKNMCAGNAPGWQNVCGAKPILR